MNIQRAKAHAEVGVLLWGAVRDAVLTLRYQGYEIELTEGSGWLSRVFYFKGDVRAINRLLEYFQRLNND